MIALAQLNEAPVGEFVAALEGIVEHSPWVAERCAAFRPVTSRLQLTDRMREVVLAAPAERQLELIRAHPKLGMRGRMHDELTSASKSEQRRAGLDALSDADYARLLELNDAYVAKFSFPFILAVRGHDPASIVESCAARLKNNALLERQTALRQIGLIAGYRLAEKVLSDDVAEVSAMSARLREATARGDSESQACLREWMLAANLEVQSDDRGNPVGRLVGTVRLARPVVLGMADEMLLGIVVAQRLRHKHLTSVGDLRLGAQPDGTSITMPWPAAGPAHVERRLSLLERILVSGASEP
jgi:OHCU decarboxylase